MSTTTIQSHITYANSAFIDASGYKEEHLIGEPHNVIRNPDMPAEAFGDMWYTLQQGESWTGLVKNRRRNGDHYWVRANVTPVYQNDTLTGYISVRNIPERHEIDASEALYQRVRNNEIKGHRFYKGVLVRRGILSFLSIFKRLSTAKRVNYSVGITALLALALPLLLPGGVIQAGGLALLFILLALFLNAQICRPVTTIVKQMQRVVSGRKTDYTHFDRVDEIGLMMRLVNQSGLNLNSLVDDVGTQISGIREISQQVAKEGDALQTRSEETSGDLQQTAAAVEEIASAVKQTAQTAEEAFTMADQTSASAYRGEAVLKQTIDVMQSVSRDNGQIVDIIAVIDRIAFQTNILALNAAVEAARAGEQGRGFAVVAGEVRNLASRSANAAKEIKGLIEESVSRVQQGSELVDTAAKTMTEIVSSVTQVNDIMGEIASASDEQRRGIEQVALAVSQMDQVTQQNAALVEEAAAATDQLAGQADHLTSLVAVFNVNERVETVTEVGRSQAVPVGT